MAADEPRPDRPAMLLAAFPRILFAAAFFPSLPFPRCGGLAAAVEVAAAVLASPKGGWRGALDFIGTLDWIGEEEVF